LFSGALFVMMAGILRCVLILLAGPNGAEQAGSWAVRETFVAVVVSNMPIIYSLLRGVFKTLSDSISSISKRSTAEPSRNVRMDDMAGSHDRRRRPGRSRDLASTYPITSSSLEHIIHAEDLDSKPHQHQHAHSHSSDAQSGPLPSKALGSPRGAEPRSPRITIATRTTISSEAAPQQLSKDASDANGLYQCRVSIEGESYP